MTRRLQVLLEDDELAEIQEMARRKRTTTSEWVRAALRDARSARGTQSVEARLRVIREAAAHSHPIGDIDQVLAEIERGYLDEVHE